MAMMMATTMMAIELLIKATEKNIVKEKDNFIKEAVCSKNDEENREEEAFKTNQIFYNGNC